MANPELREEVEVLSAESELNLEEVLQAAVQKIYKNAKPGQQERIDRAREIFDTDIEALYVHVAMLYRPDTTYEYLADKLDCTVEQVEVIANNAAAQIAEIDAADKPKFINNRRVMSADEVTRKLLASRARRPDDNLERYFEKAVAEHDAIAEGKPPRAPSTYRRNGVTLDVPVRADDKPAPFSFEPAEEKGIPTCVIVGPVGRAQLKPIDFTVLKVLKPGEYVTRKEVSRQVYPDYSSALELVSQSQMRLKIAFGKAMGPTFEAFKTARGKGMQLTAMARLPLINLDKIFAQQAAEQLTAPVPVAAPIAKAKPSTPVKPKQALKTAVKKAVKKTAAPQKKKGKAPAKHRKPAKPALRR